MADVTPFKGLRYNMDKIKDLSEVTTPPYDVISPEQQEEFYQAHPYNIIRLILGKTSDKDTETSNRYTRAAAYYEQWQFEEALVQDKNPVLYLTSVEFPVEGQPVTRFGLIARVRLSPFEDGEILPHEKTFSKVKSERLVLMKHCHANFSPIFSIYPDTEKMMGRLKEVASRKAPDMDFIDTAGHRQKLWSLEDPALHEHVAKAMKKTTLFIADGHHRYETGLNYRNWAAKNDPNFSEDHPANFILMYLASMEDEGMKIFPAHRMVKELDDAQLNQLFEKTEKYFDIFSMPFVPEEREAAEAQFLMFLKNLSDNPDVKAMGFVVKNRPEFFLIKLKPNVMEDLFADELPESVRNLDVTILTRLIFMEILGFDQEQLDNEHLIAYSSVAKEAVEAALSGDCDVSFILNPTKIEQVQRVAKDGQIMPRKSTYFYPKVITGQAINSLK